MNDDNCPQLCCKTKHKNKKNKLSDFFIFLIMVLFVVFFIGVLMFKVLFGSTWVSAFYDTTVTLTTLGTTYQNTPMTDTQLICLTIYNLISTILFVITISIFAVEMYEMYNF